ncbi:hypothetical protein ACMFMG_010629 [Clarireedia jacksonii]
MSELTGKRRSETIRGRKNTLFKKAYELGKIDGVEIAIFVFHRNQLFTYKSLENDSWPPSLDDMKLMYPLPIHLGPKDIEKKLEQKNYSTPSSMLANVVNYQEGYMRGLHTIQEELSERETKEDSDINDEKMSEDTNAN